MPFFHSQTLFIYSFLEEMDHCLCHLHQSSSSSSKPTPTLANCPFHPVQLKPAQGQKSTKPHAQLPAVDFRGHFQNKSMKPHTACSSLPPSRIVTQICESLCFQLSALCVVSFNVPLQKQGMARTYLGLQYKIYPATHDVSEHADFFFLSLQQFVQPNIFFLLSTHLSVSV